MNIVQLSIKRTFDVIVAALAMTILSPVFLVIFIALKIKGKAIFTDERIGKHGEPFMMYRLRCEEQSFLRRFHLDMLPELWNILKGDMSFVGPHPVRQSYIDEISTRTSDYNIILQMQPGLISESSLYTGKADSIDKMLKRLDLDIRYYRHRTLRLDTSILISSIPTL